MARRLFQHTEWQRDSNWVREALAAGVSDTMAFRNCLQAESTTQKLKSDKTLANEMGVRGTPTFATPHKLIAGFLTQEQLREAITDSVMKAP